MAFTHIEAEQIHEQVGGLCKRIAPNHLKDRFRMSYVIGDRGIVIYKHEMQGLSKWDEREIAKLTYFRNRHQWHLYFKRAGKWSRLDPPSRKLSTLVSQIELDKDGFFFGEPQ
jgi:hypothetical protein